MLDKFLPEGVKESLKKKIVIIPEEQRLDESMPHPSKYYVIDYFGNAVYFKTRDRATARGIADEVYGKGFFTVKQVVVVSGI